MLHWASHGAIKPERRWTPDGKGLLQEGRLGDQDQTGFHETLLKKKYLKGIHTPMARAAASSSQVPFLLEEEEAGTGESEQGRGQQTS